MYKHSIKIRQTETWDEIQYGKLSVPENISTSITVPKQVSVSL